MPVSIFPTGVTLYEPEHAFNCYVLFDAIGGLATLVDMNGNVVRQWPGRSKPAEFIDPTLCDGARGHIFSGERGPDADETDQLVEYDWDANIVWSWGEQAPGGRARQHHDQARLANGNTLILAYREEEIPSVADRPVDSVVIYEVSPEGAVVWQWAISQHLEELGFSGARLAELRAMDQGFGVHRALVLNNMAPLGPNHWFDDGDKRFHPDNIVIDSRSGNYIAIIERASGIIVWRFGPDTPAAHSLDTKSFGGPVPRPLDGTCGQHDVHMIPTDLPGAGNLLIFDNQGPSGVPPHHLGMLHGSRVIEVDPTTHEIVWQYDASCSGRCYWDFHSRHVSSARRLPNGNTIIGEGEFGRIFQVTMTGEIVWEYVSPFFEQRPAAECRPGRAGTNQIYRAQPVPYHWTPDGTSRSEQAVESTTLEKFRVPMRA